MRWIFLLLLLILTSPGADAQTCNNLGQTPGTAFPVCGTTVFSQSTVAICGNTPVPVPSCRDVLYTDKNPYWYKFTCFESGTLGFEITPNNLSDDYDWQLFDITGAAPEDVYTNPLLYVASNWSGNAGLTGTKVTGTSLTNCAGFSYPTFSALPALKEGHQYLLLVSHFTDSQSGYSLSFKDGTAVITDPAPPQMEKIVTSCDASEIKLILNKKMKCSSLADDGSDFAISPANASIVAANSASCANGFDMDTVSIRFNQPLTPGKYSVTIKNGKDGNTIADNCGANIPEGEQLLFEVLPLRPTAMDSIRAVGCAPDKIKLVFKNPIRCNSIAADGSDFSIIGTSPVTILGARANCKENLTDEVEVLFASPIVQDGNYQVQLRRGRDNNTLIDACGQETPAGATLSFQTRDTVSASFDYKINYGCTSNEVTCAHDGRNGITKWSWTFDDNSNEIEAQNVSMQYQSYGQKHIRLSVTNGVCSDTSSVSFLLDNELKAAFELPDLLCPEDEAVFKNTSVGKIISFKWNFGNGAVSTMENPPAQMYAPATGMQQFPVQLVVQNNLNCLDTITHFLKVLNSCYIAVPSAFTPNNDGLNDYLYPLNAFKADDLIFIVYNRLGQQIFTTKDWTKKWDGRINGVYQPSGTYVWTLHYVDRDSGKKVFRKGTTVLIR